MLRDIEAGSRPSGLKETTPAPRRTFIRFGKDDVREGDLYLPGEPAKAGIVLVPGLTRTAATTLVWSISPILWPVPASKFWFPTCHACARCR